MEVGLLIAKKCKKSVLGLQNGQLGQSPPFNPNGQIPSLNQGQLGQSPPFNPNGFSNMPNAGGIPGFTNQGLGQAQPF